MKKQLLLILTMLVSASASAQWINGITMQPANPTTNDPITFYADLSFPSGSCDQHTQGWMQNGNTVDAYALHCLGSLTFICDYVDTFSIGTMAAGIYTFRFHVDAGALPSPCTPGIIGGPTDSISFVVTPITGLQEITFENFDIKISPNPVSDILTINSNEEVMLALMDLNGKEVLKHQITRGKNTIDVSTFATGVYMVSLRNASGISETRRISISR